MFQFWIYDDLYFFTIQLFLYITWNSAIKTNFLLIANKIDFIFCSCRFNISLCRNKISVICFLSGYNCLYMYLFCISICIFIRIRPFAFNIFCGSCSSIFLFYTYFLFRCCLSLFLHSLFSSGIHSIYQLLPHCIIDMGKSRSFPLLVQQIRFLLTCLCYFCFPLFRVLLLIFFCILKEPVSICLLTPEIN